MQQDFSSVFVTGAGGALASYAEGCILLTKEDINVADSSFIEKVARMKPQAIIHLAAMTDQKACEENPDKAYVVNAIGAYHMALAARKAGALFCYVSTNAVFDGEGTKPFSISDTPSPHGIYGLSKYAGECLVKGVLPEALIVRTSWVFGGGLKRDKKFVGNIMRQIRGGAKELRAVSDVQGTPTYGKDLMKYLLRLIKQKRHGIIHVTNAGSASRFEMAEHIAAKRKITVVPVDAASFGATVPKNEMLQGEVMRPWQEALDEYVRTEWN